MRQLLRQILPGLTLFIVSSAICLGFIEITFRLAFSSNKPSRHITDRPGLNFYSEASANNRNPPYSEKKSANTFRIAVVGDSFTFGYGVLWDDAFPNRLERILNLNIDQPKVEVMNLGYPGASIRKDALEIARAANSLDPDLIILEITLNDPEIKPYMDGIGKLHLKGCEVKEAHPILAHWKSLTFVLQRIENSRSYYRYKDYFNGLFTNPDTVKNFQTGLSEAKQAVVGTNAKLVAIVFPLLTFPLDESYPFKDAHALIHSELEKRQIPYLDLLSSFDHLIPERLQAIPAEDPHPNEIAHRVAAEAIYKWLVRQRLVPKKAVVRTVSKKRQKVGKRSRAVLIFQENF